MRLSHTQQQRSPGQHWRSRACICLLLLLSVVSTPAWTQSEESELPNLSNLLLTETRSLKSEVESLQQRLLEREAQARDLKELSESYSSHIDLLLIEQQQLQTDLQETENLQTELQNDLNESRRLRQNLIEQYEQQLNEVKGERDRQATRATTYQRIAQWGIPAAAVVAAVVTIALR